MMNSPIAFLLEKPLKVTSLSCTRRDAKDMCVSISRRWYTGGIKVKKNPLSLLLSSEYTTLHGFSFIRVPCEGVPLSLKDLLTSKSKLSNGAEDAGEEGVEGVSIAHKYLGIHNLGNEGQQTEDDEAVEHLELWVCLLLVLFVHASGGTLDHGHELSELR